MRAAVLTATDQSPTVQEFDEPAGDAVVDVLAAGMNPFDLIKASGAMGDVITPSVVGMEGVGRLGDRRVYFGEALGDFGSFAERAPIDASQAFEVPDGVDDAQAVALGIAGMAAWLPLTRHADVAGKRVLVLGASGVAGQIAVQGAAMLGAAHVVAAGRHRETLEPLIGRGADVIAVMEDDPAGALAAEAGEGYDIVLDFVFGKPFEAAFGFLAPVATVVVIGLAAGMEATGSFTGLQGRRVIGHGNGSLPLEQRREAFTAMAEHVRDGRLNIEVETFPLDRAAEAWTAQQGSPHRKLAVVP